MDHANLRIIIVFILSCTISIVNSAQNPLPVQQLVRQRHSSPVVFSSLHKHINVIKPIRTAVIPFQKNVRNRRAASKKNIRSKRSFMKMMGGGGGGGGGCGSMMMGGCGGGCSAPMMGGCGGNMMSMMKMIPAQLMGLASGAKMMMSNLMMGGGD